MVVCLEDIDRCRLAVHVLAHSEADVARPQSTLVTIRVAVHHGPSRRPAPADVARPEEEVGDRFGRGVVVERGRRRHRRRRRRGCVARSGGGLLIEAGTFRSLWWHECGVVGWLETGRS